MGTWKRGLLDWPVRALRRAGVAGRCDCWRIKVVELELVDSLSHETVRQTLKKRPEAVAEGDVVHPPPPPPPPNKQDGPFVARMEQLWKLYSQPYDPRFPVVYKFVCKNEKRAVTTDGWLESDV